MDFPPFNNITLNNLNNPNNRPNMHLEPCYMLRATLTRPNGQPVEAEIDLNCILGNVNGTFAWGRRGFMSSALNATLFFDELREQVVLSATLQNIYGQGVAASIDLGQQIFIVDAHFCYFPTPPNVQNIVRGLWSGV